MLGSSARLSRRKKTHKNPELCSTFSKKDGFYGIAVCFKVEFALGNRIGFTPVDAWMPTNHSLPHLKAEFGR